MDETGNVFVTGWIRNAAGTDTAGFVRRHTASGSFDWVARVRTAGFEGVFDVAVDGEGHAWVVGNVSGRLPGQTTKGGYDAFIREYAPDGSISGPSSSGRQSTTSPTLSPSTAPATCTWPA